MLDIVLVATRNCSISSVFPGRGSQHSSRSCQPALTRNAAARSSPCHVSQHSGELRIDLLCSAHTQSSIYRISKVQLPSNLAVGDGGAGVQGETCVLLQERVWNDVAVPPKIGKKYFLGNYYVKFWHFSGKNLVKFGNFVSFSGKYNKNSGILTIFRARIV